MEKKRCSKCGELKSTSEFWPDYRERARGKPHLLKSWCKRCHSADNVKREKHKKAVSEAFREQRRESARKRRFQKKYGITQDEYDQILREQGGVCAICGSGERTMNTGGTPRMLAVDHDHDTGRVRGILCEWCNRAIGLLKDNPTILRRAAEYLERNASEVSK